jgi:hypothetical protein
LTLRFPAPTMQPESSDGFASVGTILPRKELPCCRAALSAFEALSNLTGVQEARRAELVTPGASLTTNLFRVEGRYVSLDSLN